MNDVFEIKGGKKLSGSITPQGAKNEALQILCAVLLTDEEVVVENIPDILDVNMLIEILTDMGVEVSKLDKGKYSLRARNIDVEYMRTESFRKKSGKLRGAVMLSGPLLARFGHAYLPQPGGDKIGRRRLDTHIRGFEKLGISFNYDDSRQEFVLKAEKFRAADILLDEPSVTGTANIIMAAVKAPGTTTIYNAACEPYVQQLCRMLNRMGAKISGIGSNLLTIEGVDRLSGCSHRMLADMIEVGSFMVMAAMTQSSIRIKDADVDHLGMLLPTINKLGVKYTIDDNDIVVHEQELCELETFIDGSILTIYDHPWPGLSPDLLSVLLVLATQARGTLMIHQKMFESRLFFVDKLIDMGARIVLCDPHRAVVIGLERKVHLKGLRMSSPDIRAGVALLIAALSAEGTSVIENIHQIDRGYENIDERLRALGADIQRIKD